MPGRSARRDLAIIIAIVLALSALVLITRNSYYQLVLALVPVWATLGLSWNILSGYTGLTSFGHAAFFGLGAYTVALLIIHAGLTPWLGVPLGGVVSALGGIL